MSRARTPCTNALADGSVMMFDDTALSSLTTPPLTTVRVPQYEIGVAVAARILEELTGNAPSQKVDDLGFEIVERESL